MVCWPDADTGMGLETENIKSPAPLYEHVGYFVRELLINTFEVSSCCNGEGQTIVVNMIGCRSAFVGCGTGNVPIAKATYGYGWLRPVFFPLWA